MSENLEPMLTLMNSLPSLLKQTESDLSACKTTESNGIFDLISHLNDLNNNNRRASVQEEEEEYNEIQTPSENTSEHFGDEYDNDDCDQDTDEQTHLKKNHKEQKQNDDTSVENAENTAPKPTRIPMARQMASNKTPLIQSNNLSINNKNTSNNINQQLQQTKIPRIAASKLPVRPATTNLTSLPLDLTSSSVSSISQPDTDENAKSFSNRTPRSFLKAPTVLAHKQVNSNNGDGVADSSSIKNNKDLTSSSSTESRQVLKDKKTLINNVNKRGQSQSAAFSSKSSSNRSLSNADTSFFLNEQNLLKDNNKKQVRYIIRHKPRESQVASVLENLNLYRLNFS